MPLPDDLPWVRLWSRPDTDAGFETAGFAYRFDHDLIDSLPPEYPQPLENLRDVPVLILLGEAGMGKSNAIEQEHKTLAGESSCASYLLNLADFSSEGHLRECLQGILSESPVSGCLILHLDSFDECRLDIGNLARLLEGELKWCRIGHAALTLRITCRSTEWPSSLTAGLQRIWGESAVELRELCPLTKQDAATAAHAADLDPEAFLEAVYARDCESLACRPKTLAYLIEEQQHSGTLPTRRWDLYANGIGKLCEEDIRRHDNDRGGYLTALQRMQLAEKLAVAMLFTNSGGFFLESHGAADARSLLALETLAESEHAFTAPAVTVKALRETLRIGGLFERRPDGAVRFRHRSDAEFLAASFLWRWGISAHTIMTLLQDPVGLWLPPQLAGVAAWIAEKVPEVRDWLIREYPLQFLSSDADIDAATRETLLQSLMQLARARAEVLSVPWHRLARLDYPGLSESLRDTITNRRRDLVERYLALDIAESCGLASELTQQCVRLFHDPAEVEGLRAKAGHLLCNLAEVDHWSALVALEPYVRQEREDDPGGRFRSMALEALWPDHIDAESFFMAITPRRNKVIIGSHVLLPRRLEETIEKAHLPAALKWVSHLEHDAMVGDLTLQKVADVVMRHAWDHIQDGSILRLFAEAVLICLERNESIFNRAGNRSMEGNDPFDDVVKRRLVIEELIKVTDAVDTLRLPAMDLVQDDDIPWLIEGMATGERKNREIRAALVEFRYRNTMDPSITDLVLDKGGPHAAAPIPELQAALTDTFSPIDPQSEFAARLRKQLTYRRQIKAEDERQTQRKTRREQIDEAMQLRESHPIEAWWRLIVALDCNPDRASAGSVPASLPDTHGWSELDINECGGLPSFALSYLHRQDPSSAFLATYERWTAGDMAAYTAFDLIAIETPEPAIDAADIQRWLPVLLSYPFAYQENQSRRGYVLRWLMAREPEAFVRELREQITRDARNGSLGFTRADEFDAVWSPNVAQAVRELAADTSLPYRSRLALWRWLLQRKDTDAAEHLRACISCSHRTPEAQHAAALLLEEWPTHAWEELTVFLDGDPANAKDAVQTIVDRYRRATDTWFALSADKQAYIYTVLERHFPHSDERNPATETYHIGTQEHARDLKGFILDWLKNAGTDVSVQALDSLIDAFPEHDWLKRYRHQAQDVARQVGWVSFDAAELVALLSNDRRRVVRSDDELMSVVIESLARLDVRLQGVTPMAPFLWDERSGTHKAEDRLSDFVKDHLRMDLQIAGIVINREVEIRNLKDRGVGERTDLLVEAADAKGDVHAVVIEVKGEWNPDLDSAMETQLRQRYLEGVGYRCGIYLVGWAGIKPNKFPRPQTVLDRFRKQAKSLSSATVNIQAYALNVSWSPK